MLKENIRKLRVSAFILAERNESNLLSYWSGYFENRYDEKNELINLIGTYLKQEYNIEEKLTTWVEQIDQYAFLKKIEWFESFYTLLAEMQDNNIDEIDVVKEGYYNLIKVKNKGKVINEIVSKEGIKVRSGDVLRFSDKIGTDYKKTKHFDATIKKPSWDLFYPSKKDFKFIRFMHKGEKPKMDKVTYGNVWRVFSNFPTTVQSIEVRNGRHYINTEIFEIEFQNALNAEEFSVALEDSIPKNFSYVIEDLNSMIENYRLGLTTHNEFRLGQFISNNLRRFNFDWQNYERYFASNSGRPWREIKK